ncbi:hypothetical protein STRDD12_01282 [Streptococcus sp. DD12]|nr:hypothetical protein STRDD12_01282 [Streptococcus sp. DD12]
MLVTVLGIFLINNQKSKPLKNSLYQTIAKENYVTLTDGYAKSVYGDEVGQTFSVKTQELYGDDIAVKGDKVYGTELDGQTAKAFYREVWKEALEATKYLQINKSAIKKANYKVTLDLADTWGNLKLSSDSRGNNDILNDYKDKTLKCLRIHFDKSYRPTRIEGYYQADGDRGWYNLLYLAYPDLTKASFDSKLDAYIQTIQAQPDEDEESEQVEDTE